MARQHTLGNNVLADVRSASENWFSFGWLAPSVAFANAVVLVGVVRYLNPSTLPFLTDGIDRVAQFIRLALAISLIGNVTRIWYSPSWFVGLADLVATLAGMVATLRLFQVFPFDFDDGTTPWTTVVRLLLIAAMVGAAFGIALSMSRLLAHGADGGRRGRWGIRPAKRRRRPKGPLAEVAK